MPSSCKFEDVSVCLQADRSDMPATIHIVYMVLLLIKVIMSRARKPGNGRKKANLILYPSSQIESGLAVNAITVFCTITTIGADFVLLRGNVSSAIEAIRFSR